MRASTSAGAGGASPASRSVAVVGAGAAGLVTARELLREGHRVQLYEQASDRAGPGGASHGGPAGALPGAPRCPPTLRPGDLYMQLLDVGGVWKYDERVEADPLGQDGARATVHSSMYRSLRTNLPREVMGYLDFPFHPRTIRLAGEQVRSRAR